MSNTYAARFLSTKERFLQFVATSDGCWIWQGHRQPRGYGSFSMKGRHISAHRASWAIYHGAIPAGMMVCHRCDTPECVNPDHLFLGSPSDNMRDKVAKGRANAPRGERGGGAKLTADVVLKIRSEAGSCASIAAKYGISPMHVNRIQRRERWAHV